MNASSSDSPLDSSHPVANLPIPGGDRREAFFGLIAPIGVDLDAVTLALTRSLSNIGYETNEIRLTDIFRKYPHWYDVKYKTEEDKYKKYIRAGDDLRKETERDDILALYSIARLRDTHDRDPKMQVPQNVVHIFRQIKRSEEITVYKEIFGRNILFISCYSPRKDRIANLVKKMLKSERGVIKTKLESKALDIISIDEDEREDNHGQRVVECYPHADFVLDCTNHQTLTESADRLVQIYFGAPFVSPNKDEYASYIANAASYRSLDLSRQVGAAIFGKDCEIISVGCNEVPRAGGGTYWADGVADHRDYAVGYDSNQKVRDDMTRDALVRLQDKGWLTDRFANLSPDELVAEAFEPQATSEPPLRDSMMRDIIEFGRMVHAEMNALADAARFRRSTIDATLYCTTLPMSHVRKADYCRWNSKSRVRSTVYKELGRRIVR
jgi:deoxycytidylate deaminase